MNPVVVEVCSRIFDYPNECPCCGGEPDSELAITFKASARTMAADSARKLLFPYCRHCVEHVSVWQAGSMTSALLTLVGFIGGLVVGFTGTGWYGLIVFLGFIGLASFITSISQSRARIRCQPSCATPAKAVTFFGWSGSTSTFGFSSPTYTARFAEQNASSLVSVDAPLRNLLEAHKVARLQVPTPAAATRVVPQPRSLAEWIKHLEQQPTRIARRIALTRALNGLHDEEERTSVVEVVCRAELVPVLEEMDSLPRSAKKRHLDRAIAVIRADNVPDELRDAQLAELVSLSLKVG